VIPKALLVIDTIAPAGCALVAAGPISDADALQIGLRLKTLADPAPVKIVSYLFSSSAVRRIPGSRQRCWTSASAPSAST
jgi:hypothetical protein